MVRRRALQDQKRATDEGRWDKMASAINTQQNAENEIKRLQAKTYGDQARAMLEEQKIAEMAAGTKDSREARKQSANESLLRSYDASITTAVERIEKTLESKHPMAKAFRMSTEAQKSNPKAYKEYLDDQKKLYDQVITPLEKDRDALRQKMQGYGGWGNLKIS